jgi:hypothetical protein
MFYNLSQNNSGGYFLEDDEVGVCENIIIEVNDITELEDRFDEIAAKVPGFHDYCECCGERWHLPWRNESGDVEPMMYGESVYTIDPEMFRSRCFIHFLDGRVEEVIYNKNAKNTVNQLPNS